MREDEVKKNVGLLFGSAKLIKEILEPWGPISGGGREGESDRQSNLRDES